MDLDQRDAEPSASGDEFGDLHGALRLDGVEDQQRRAEIEAKLFGLPLEPVGIGRYAILRKLGAGGMGVVYVAYDERLDRRVAVKLLRRESSIAAARLEREAQAMARLSHPNVVTVHEVGTHAGQVFVAMEFVAGGDLRTWLGAETRPWQDVVDAFRQAGEGLAAAHAAGIVHRDFKPDNVLVGDDARVRVADFGLAHGFDHTLERAANSSPDARLSLTRTGALAGTPAYMPPEQYLGGRSDARSDQFSFCVALWEGLYGQRPFAGADFQSLAGAILDGALDMPADARGVPPWVQAIVLRGLARDPAQRWPSMRALLDALADDPSLRWRRLGLALLLVLGGLALVAVAWLAAHELRDNARQRYFSGLTAALLELERERGLRQAQDDAARARDATRMSAVRSLARRDEARERRREFGDPTAIATMLREVEGEQRETSEWLSAANRVLGGDLSLAVLRGHRGEISALTYAPDGRWLISGSTDGEVWRWDATRFRGRRIVAHAGEVTRLAYSADGRWLASASVDGTVQLWSVHDEAARVLRAQQAGIRDLAFDPRGRWLASGSEDGTVVLHPLDPDPNPDPNPKPARVLDAQAGIVLALDFDPTGAWLLTGSSDGRARLWSVEDEAREPAAVLVGHDEGVYFVELLSAARAVTAADDGTARAWTLSGDQPTSVIVARHPQAIAAMDVHGDQVATGSLDGSVRVSSLLAPYTSVALPDHLDQVWAVAFVDDGRQVVSASFDRRARISRADGRGDPRELVGHTGPIYVLALDHAGRRLATGSYDAELRIWDLQRPRLTTTLRGHADTVFTVEVDAGGTRAVTASHDGSARVWSVTEGISLARLDAAGRGESTGPIGEDLALNHAVLSPDGRRVATARNDGRVSLWTLADAGEFILGEVASGAWRLAFDASGRRLAAGSKTGQVRVWDLDDPEREAIALRGHEQFIAALAFERGTGHLVTASWDGSVRVWDPTTGASLATLREHAGKLYALAQSPDGRTWATGSDDGSARLWLGLDASAASRALVGHDKAVWSLAFDAGGERLVTGGHDGRALIWSVDEGQLLEALEGHGGKIWDVEVLADGRVVTAAGDGALRIWTPGSGTPPLRFDDHGADVQSLAVGLGGARVLSASADGTAKSWRVDLLRTDTAPLREQLWRATSVCLDPEQRRREFGETREAAAAGVATCEQTVATRVPEP